MKKLLALILALLMVLSLFAGCGKTEEPAAEPEIPAEAPAEAPAETPAEEPADEAWKEEHPTWLCEEKTTLSVYTWEGVSSSFLPPSNDLWFWQWMEEYTNVHIEWEVVPYADYNTLVSAKLAGGGDLNDIILMGDVASVANNAGVNGMVIDLSPYWDTCFTNIQAYMDEAGVNYKNNISNADGTCYAMCTLGAPIENRVILMFNTQWMDELGLEIPTSIDELTEVLRAMKAAGDLNGNGADDEIILTSPSVGCLTASLDSAFGIEALEGEPYFAADENGVVYDEYTTENNKALLRWLNGLYNEKILDPEITINTMDIVSEKVTADRVGCVAFYASFASSYGDLTSAGQANPGEEYYTMMVPMTSEFVSEPYMTMYECYIMFTGISSSCENPELAAKWLDTLYADPTVLENRCRGKEGETWEYDANGEAVPIYVDGKFDIRGLGAGQLSLPYVQTEEQLLFSKKGHQDWFLEQYAKIRDSKWKARSVPLVPGYTEEEAMLRDMYWADLDAGWNEYRDKFILGELNVDADWEQFVSAMEALGLKEMTECYQSVYDRTR